MNDQAKAALAALLSALEIPAEAAAAAAGGPVAGTAAAAALATGAAMLQPPVIQPAPAAAPATPVAVAVAAPAVAVDPSAPVPAAAAGATGVSTVLNGGNVSAADFASLKTQMDMLVSLFKAQQDSLSQVAATVQDLRAEKPGAGIQPFTTDPNAHPILVAAGRAKQVAPDPSETARDLDASADMPAVIAAVNALHSKVDALVEATGMGGSAAMAAHAT